MNLFSPGRIGSVYLRNRIIMAPIGSRLTSENGAVTDGMIDFYSLRAKGGAGAIIIEAMGIDYPLGVGKPNHVRFHDDCFIPGHALLAERIHEHGAKAFAMLWHTGINRGMFCGQTPVGPSPILNPNTGIVPKELTVDEITAIVAKFGEAGRRAKLCEYDGVEIHGGHGYLISSFVSRATNQRSDKYGGSFENRIRFALEIVQAIQKQAGRDYPILFRINGDDFCENGITSDEAVEFSLALEAAGVAAVDVSAGVYSSIDRMIEPVQYGEGWKIYLAEKVKRHLRIPVIGVGVLRTPEKVNAILQEGKVDFAALGRELLCEPFWVEKVRKGDKHLLYCISCNSCFERIGNNLPIRCAVNPRTGRESRAERAVSGDERKRIAVVGAGPAGISAALVASRRGHTVTLFEESDRIGGQLLLAAVPPGKEKVTDFLQYLMHEVSQSSITLRMSTCFTRDIAKDERFDEIIIATGACSKDLQIEGAGAEEKLTAWEALQSEDSRFAGKNIIVVGAGSVGCETALYIQGRKAESVAIVEIRDQVGADIDFITRKKILAELKEAGIEVYPSMSVGGYDKRTRKARLQSSKQGQGIELSCDLIVIAVGSKSADELLEELFACGFSVHPVGDSIQIGKIGDAVRAGYNIAVNI